MQDVGKYWKRACADGTQRQAGQAGLTPGPESSAGYTLSVAWCLFSLKAL